MEILKKEHKGYTQCSENLYRKAEERLREKEDYFTKMWMHVEALRQINWNG